MAAEEGKKGGRSRWGRKNSARGKGQGEWIREKKASGKVLWRGEKEFL